MSVKLKTVALFLIEAVIVAFLGYVLGAWQWRGIAVLKSYEIGFEQGYSTGASDASIPGAEVTEIRPDGSAVHRINPKEQPE